MPLQQVSALNNAASLVQLCFNS